MERIILLILFICAITITQAQSSCYEPNLRKANAEYAKGNYSQAYEYYLRATKCPDASRFDNGRQASLGVKKCLPTISIEGIRKYEGQCPTDTISYKGGRKTFRVLFKNAVDWEINSIGHDSSWIRIVEQNHSMGTFTIEFTENKKPTSRKSSNITIRLNGGVEYEDTHFHLYQEGNTSLLVDGETSRSIDVGYQGGKYFVDITSQTEWNFLVKESDSLWLSAEKVKVTGNTNNGRLIIQIKDNINSPKRNGQVIVSAGEIQCTVYVKQNEDPNYNEALWVDKAYMDIKDLVLYNSFDGFSSLGNSLYANNITYIVPRILYEGKALNKQTKIDTLYLKIYENGKLIRNETVSPIGYTYYSDGMTIWSDGELNGLNVNGWGNGTGNSYGFGTYRCEIWYRGKMLASKEIKLTYANAPKITKIDFAKTDTKGSVIGEYGNTFDIEDMEYLMPRIHFDNPGNDLKSKSFNMIVTDPDGNKVNSFVIYKDGRETTIDSIRYRNRVKLMKSGSAQTAEMIPWKSPFLKSKSGTWKFELYYGTNVKVAETTFFLYSKEKYLMIDGKVRSEIPITAYAGCKTIKLKTTSKSKKYKITVVPEEAASKYKPTVVFEHSPSGDTTIIQQNKALSSFSSTKTEPVRIEMASDTSFVIRWLCLGSPSKGSDNKRFTITVTNDEGIAEMCFFTPADSVVAFVDRKQKKLPISVKKELLEMVYIEGGDYVLGSTSDSPTQYAQKAHVQHVKDFYMSTYPVTQNLWEKVMGAKPKAGWSRKLGKDDDFVAYNITFEEAVTFVKKLNEITGMKFAIPSEEEFEYVFRGGKLATEWGYDYGSCRVWVKSAKGKYGYEYINNRTVRLYSRPNVRYSVGDDMTINVLRLVLHP